MPQIIKKKGNEARWQRWGYFFVIPFILAFGFFNLYPTIYTLSLSFSDLKGLRTDYDFVGLANYVRLLKDSNFWNAIKNTFIIWGFNFIPQLGLALILSIWLSDTQLNLKCKGVFRAVIYMPNILTTASVAMLFRSLFGYGSPPTAPVNIVLQSWGLFQTYIQDGQVVRGAFDFFRSVAFSRGLVSFIQWWLFYGVTVILLMAGITSIPVTLYESALVDGANSRQTAWRITLPLLRPMMLYLLVTSMIGGMQILDIPMLLTDGRGSPNLSIRTTTLFLYNVGFSGANDYAYAASISVGMFIITVFLALIIFFFLQDRSELKKERKGV